MALSLIFTFGWAAGVLLFLFLMNALLDLGIWGLLRYGRNVFLTSGLFLGLFAIPFTGYYVLPLHRTGRTAGFLFLHLRMVREGEDPSLQFGRERTFQRIGYYRAFVAAIPALLAGIVVLSFLPDASDRPTTPDLLDVLRLPTAFAYILFILSQLLDRLSGKQSTLGVHERLARVHVIREPRMRELMEQERRVTEAHIAGGMAHEIRNALGTARLQLDRVVDSDVATRTQKALEDILRSLTESSGNGSDRDNLKRAVAGVRRIYDDRNLIKRVLQEVSTAVDRGLRITRRVMDYSKIQPAEEARRIHDGASAPVDPNRLVSDLAESYREALANEGIRLQLDLQASRSITANAGHCYSVIQNLLLNARDAIREKWKSASPPEGLAGVIRVSTGDTDKVWIRCEDNGVGIPTAQLERIFDPFFSTKPSEGMGLGLNECRRIVDLYGGEIQVDSEVGRGTQITIFWRAIEPAVRN
jgi:signal transduction histidine kinase